MGLDLDKNLSCVLPITLATLKKGGRDGSLVVVSANRKTYQPAPPAFQTLQKALENWDKAIKEFHHITMMLETHQGMPLPAYSDFYAPLPRAYQWLDGSSYKNHTELIRKALGGKEADVKWESPLMYQGASDRLSGSCDPIVVSDEGYGVDFEGELGVITDDVPMGINAFEALSHIKLLTLVNDVSLREFIPDEFSKGFGFINSKPSTAFAPFAITPAVLGEFWENGKVKLPLNISIKRAQEDHYTFFGAPKADQDMYFNFGDLIAHAAKTRHLHAGTIIGSGTVSNQDPSTGAGCIMEQRMMEVIAGGKAKTAFLNFGDTVRMHVSGPRGDQAEYNYFGAIDQIVQPY